MIFLQFLFLRKTFSVLHTDLLLLKKKKRKINNTINVTRSHANVSMSCFVFWPHWFVQPTDRCYIWDKLDVCSGARRVSPHVFWVIYLPIPASVWAPSYSSATLNILFVA